MRREKGKGEGVTYARTRACSLYARILVVCVSAWQEFQRREREGVRKSAHCPRTGSDRARGGLVWFSLDTNASVSLMLRVETVRKKAVERRIPTPEEAENERV